MQSRSRKAASFLFALTMTQAAPAETWKVETLGIPVNAVNYENTGGVLSAGPGGEGRMFYTSYYRSTGAELVGYDFRTNTTVRKRLGSNGGYGIAVGTDGSVYVGGVNPGDLYRYDPKTDELTATTVKQFGVQYIWDCAIGNDGTVYCAAGYPKTKLVAYDPKMNRARDLGEMVPGEQYLRSLCVDKQGKVWCGVGMKAHLVVYDPATRTKQEVLPKEYANSSSAYDTTAVGDYVATNVNFDGVLLIYDSATMRLVRTIPKPANQKAWMISSGGHDHIAYLWTLPNMDACRCDLRDGKLTLLVENLGQVKIVEADRWLHTVDDQSYLAYDLQEKKIVARKVITEGGDGMDVFSLTRGADGNIYGSTYINMHLFRCDADTGTLTDLGKALRWAGQVDSMSLGSDGRIYIGAYTDAVVAIYDPKQPWQPGLKADSNPREIGPVGKGQYRTRANCLGPDGHVYVGSIPAYRSAETGAFTICDPKTGKMDVRTDFVKGGAVDTLVADDLYVYGAGGGEFFVYDPKTDKKVFREERKVTALAVLKGNKVAVSGNGKIAVYDRQQGKIIDEKPNPAADFTHMATGPDGLVYGVNPKHVARISTDATVENLTDEGGKFAAVDSQGRVYFARGPRLLRCSPP
ncbi:MAG: PQQ-binding-like beta-propeller repeat protein [Phycisphaerae bacterium]|nr:PQQ-binding-like beta-propeller repeat protein [Phycisphaerae bacterium]